MTELAGALTTFSSTIRPRDLPLYDHDDLGNRISMLDAKLRSLLETRRARNFAAFVPGNLPNPEMELLILLPNQSAS
jgi:type VI secretion system protein ImpJ